jgi:hypothetical protein
MLDFFQIAEKFALKYFESLVSRGTKEPEAPKNAPFGEWAWAKYREGVPEEPDNELEKQVYQDIKKHFASKRTGLPKFTVRLLTKLIEKGWYKSVLHAPVHKTLYRGLKISDKQILLKILKIKNEDFKDEGSINFKSQLVIPPTNGHSTSWTFQKKITQDFSTNYGKAKRGYIVTLIADVGDNEHRFLAGPGGLYDVEGLSMWHLEKETVGLEPIKIKRAEWKKI